MSNAISDVGNAVSSIGHSIGNAITNPAQLIGTGLGLGIGGVGGLTGGNLAGNAITGQPIGTNLRGSISGDALGLAAGGGIAGLMGPGSVPGAGGELFGGYTVDPATGDVIPAGGGGGFGGFGGYTVDPATGDVIPTGGGGTGVGAGGTISGGGFGGSSFIGPGASALTRFLGGGGGGGAMAGNAGGGSSLLNFLTGQTGGPSLPSLAPGLAALQYARNQNPVDTSQLQNVYGAAGANAPLFVQAAQDPLKQAQAGGYGDILQSQANRGIRGSSFGDQDISNYLTDTNRGIADAGASAAQASLGLQGSLAGQISNLNALSQQMKNNLYGRAFSMLGQGLNPTPGMGGTGLPGMSGMGGVPTSPGGAPMVGPGFMNNLGLGGVASAFGNGLGSIGSGLGSIFGSPGSSFWGPASGLPLANAGQDSIDLSGTLGLAGF